MNILVLYNCEELPLRATVRDHLYSLRRYSPHRCFYLNVMVQGVPWYIGKVRFDLIAFHTIFLSARWSLHGFRRLLGKARALKHVDAVKVAVPQDEFIHTDVLCDFINEFKIEALFSAAVERDRLKIYSGVAPGAVRFFRVLTGYLDDETVGRIGRLAESSPPRAVDIGYRAWRAEPGARGPGTFKFGIPPLFPP